MASFGFMGAICPSKMALTPWTDASPKSTSTLFITLQSKSIYENVRDRISMAKQILESYLARSILSN